MKPLSKEEFLDADDLPLTAVELPAELYGDGRGVFVRSMSGTERAKLEKRFFGRDARESPGEFRATVLMLAVVDAKGQPLFSDDDRQKLMGKNARGLEVIFTKACRLNGFTKEDVEARKND